MKIEDGKLYVIGDGRVLKASYYLNEFSMYDKDNNYICDVDEDGNCDYRPETYSVVKEYKRMQIKNGKKYVTNGGRVVTVKYYDGSTYGFSLISENGDRICLVNKFGIAQYDDPKNSIDREYIDNIKQVYLDQTTGKTYDSLEELKASRDDSECRVTLREAISDSIPGYVDFDVEEFIYLLKCAKNKEQVLEYLKKEIL